MEATQSPRDIGSVLPKSFNLSTASGDRIWVAPNATKHIWEETRGLTFGRAISQEQRLIGLAAAVDNTTIGNWEQLQVCRGWELIFSEPRAVELILYSSTQGMWETAAHDNYEAGHRLEPVYVEFNEYVPFTITTCASPSDPNRIDGLAPGRFSSGLRRSKASLQSAQAGLLPSGHPSWQLT